MKLLDARLVKQVPRVRRLLLLASILSAAQGLVVVAQAVALSRLIVRVFVDRWGVAQIAELLQWVALIILMRAALVYVGDVVAARASAVARSDLRRGLLAAVAHGGPAVTRHVEPATLAVLATKGIDSLDLYFSKVLPMITAAAVVPITALAVIGVSDRVSLGIICATLPLVPFFMVLVGKETQVHAGKQWLSMARLAGHLLDLVSGLVTLHIFGRARNQASALRVTGEEYRKRTMKVLRVSFLSTLVLELISTLSIALVAVSIGLRLVNGRMELVAGLTVLLLAPEVYQPLRTLGTQFHSAADGLEAAAQVLAVMDESQQVTSGEEDSVIPSDVSGITVILNDVAFAYDSGQGLSRLTEEFHPGRVHVIRGSSGAGKTTMLNLILGFLQPTSGTVSICGIDLSQVDMAWWRSQAAYVPQRPWLPRASIREALHMVAPWADDERMLSALATAGLAAGDSALPKGLDTQVFELRTGVSVGQMRRIALARALLLQRPLLLLDEPTAGLDSVASAHIARAVRTQADAGVTVVVITHGDGFDLVADRVVDVEAVMV